MANQNALIALAIVSENAKNPYATFCEYIKYCVFTYVKDKMTISELQNAIGQEFGLCIPHNVILRCLSIVTEEKVLSFRNHQIYRVGDFDTKGFEDCRKEYRANEATLVEALIKYVEPFGKEWTFDFAREQLIKVLDRNGLAYEIFMNGHIVHDNGTPAPTDSHIDNLIPDDAEVEKIEDIESQPLYADSFYVGKFVEKLLGEGTTESEYLRKVCEGLMICVGAYQLPTTDKNSTVAQIKGTTFFFDTRLLLRSLGCAGTPAVNAVRELVKLIQDAGGIIAYYPHTLQEIYNAFDDALKKLEDNDVPHDDEMRIYAASVSNNIAVITAKKATVREELAKDNIWLRELETFSDSDRIHFGFDYNALKLFMRRRLQWDPRTIENDALSIWETHMRRKGNYREYCGTNDHLCVFVTSNQQLIYISLEFRKDNEDTKEISGWKKNRLPVITDVKLTCRLWSPSDQAEGLSALYLAANAVAAQRPTQRYLQRIRNLAIELEKQVPEYSGICLPAYFDDNITNALFEETQGDEDNLSIGTFAGTIEELAEWKAKELGEEVQKANEQKIDIGRRLTDQTNAIIEDAVNRYVGKLGVWNAILWIGIHWSLVVTFIFTVISALIVFMTKESIFFVVVGIPIILKIIEATTGSYFVQRFILGKLHPKAERNYRKSIYVKISKVAKPYIEQIAEQCVAKTAILEQCKKIIQV